MTRLSGMNGRPPRIDLRRPAVLIDSDGIESTATILDVSSAGLRLYVSESLRLGELVTLRAEHGEACPLEIRWTLGNEAGAVFLTPVDYGEWTQDGGPPMAGNDSHPGKEQAEGTGRRQGGDRRQGELHDRRGDKHRRKGDRRTDIRRSSPKGKIS